jgi:hypothetical protein
LQELFRRHAAGKHFKHMAHRDPHAPNRRFSTAHIGFDRDPIDIYIALFYKNLRITQSNFASSRGLVLLPVVLQLDSSFRNSRWGKETTRGIDGL